MTAQQVDEMGKRGQKVRSVLTTVLTEIQKLIDEIDAKTEPSNDDESLVDCLANAKLSLEEAQEFYTSFLGEK